MTEILWTERASKAELSIKNVINGKVAPQEANGAAIEKLSPRNGERLYTLHSGSASDVDAAVAAARAAFDDRRWSGKTLGERAAVLLKLAGLVEKKAEELALLESLDVGKPISIALHGDIPRAVAPLREAAHSADKLLAPSASDGTNFIYGLRKPVGVVGGITGWNFPLVLATTKVGPALMTGNTLVLKPSEFTSLSTWRLAELALEAGVPEGVFNVVHGAGATVGDALGRHNDVDLLSFTGSSATGKKLMVSAGESNMKRLILECGGKSPYLVFEDAPGDLDFLADDIAATMYQNQGEVCSASTRLLVQDSIKDELVAKVVERAKAMTPADPLDPATTFGALINEPHLKKVEGYVQSGLEAGATKLCGGERVMEETGGYYMSPCVFDNVPPGSRIAQEEIFGPVLSIFSFKDEAEAVALANSTSFGLTAYAATKDLARAHRLARRVTAGYMMIVGTDALSAGGVSIGGEAQKQSGFGTEGGLEGLAAYTAQSTVYIFG